MDNKSFLRGDSVEDIHYSLTRSEFIKSNNLFINNKEQINSKKIFHIIDDDKSTGHLEILSKYGINTYKTMQEEKKKNSKVDLSI